jgi:drug/metabolite transporter (DMT)-like permease
MLCWGLAYVPSAWLTDAVGPFAAAAWRLGLGGVVLFAVLKALGQSVNPGVSWKALVWLGLTQTVIFYGAQYWGIAHGGAGLTSVLANSDPLFVAVLAAMFLGEYLTSTQRVGLAFGFVGVGFAVCSQGGWPPRPTWAAVVVLFGALGWAVGTVVATRAMRRDSNPMALAAWQMFLGALALALLSPIGGHTPVPTRWSTAGLIVFLAVVCSALPTAMFYAALRTGVASELSALFFLVPVVGVATAWPLLGEAVTLPLAIGLVGICIGLWLVLRPRQPLVESGPVMPPNRPSELP